MKDRVFYDILRKHSTTFYYGSLLLPKTIRRDVAIVYSFLRTFDDIVDIKNDKKLFLKLKNETLLAIDGKIKSDNFIINSFVDVFKKYSLSKNWLDLFFNSLEKDLQPYLEIQTRQEFYDYIHGVAGIVGLMMAKIMDLEEAFYDSAVKFGQSMQIINIIRDIKEDFERKRVYIPKEDITKFGLKGIDDFQGDNMLKFNNLIRFYLEISFQTFKDISKVVDKIPYSKRKSIEISLEIYKKLATMIYNNPILIWNKKISLSKIEKFLIFLRYIIR